MINKQQSFQERAYLSKLLYSSLTNWNQKGRVIDLFHEIFFPNM